MQYVAAMVRLFGDCALRLCDKLETVAAAGGTAEMEQLFSRVTLDVIGKAVFNYDFDSLSRDTGIIEVSGGGHTRLASLLLGSPVSTDGACGRRCM